MGQKPIDVEDLVAWAAAELARKRPGKIGVLPVLGTRLDREIVGRWASPMGYPRMSPMFAAGLGTSGARGDPPHPDALAVEAAIDEVGAALAAEPSPHLAEGDDLLFGLGFQNVDGQGALAAALANVRNLLLVHGRLRSRPLIRLEPPQPAPKLAENGKPGVWRREEWTEPTWQDHAPETARWVETAVRAKRKDLYPDGAYGRLEYTPDPQELVNERADYVAWRAGLVALAERLHDGMAAHVALPPGAAVRPWMQDKDGAPIRDLFRPGAEGVYSAREAAALQGDRMAARRRAIHGGAVYRGRPVKPVRRAWESEG